MQTKKQQLRPYFQNKTILTAETENMMKPRFFQFGRQVTTLLFVVYLLASCSATRFVPEGSYLLNDVDIHADNNKLKKEELLKQIRQRENLTILGFLKFHLAMYNLSSKEKTDDWLKRIGEAPVIYQDYQTIQSMQHLQVYLRNKGYYDAIVADTIIFNEKKRKANLAFTIQSGLPYLVNNYRYRIDDPRLAPLVFSDTAYQTVKPGDIFDVDELNAERQRIATLLKNHGYYDFSVDNVQYLADTTLTAKEVDLTMEIGDGDLNSESDSLVHFRKYVVRNYRINTSFAPMQLAQKNGEMALDTLFEPPYTFIYKDKLRYNRELLENINRIKDSTYYSLLNVEKTFRSLNQLQQFKVVNLNFDEVPELGNDSIGVLDCNLLLSPNPRQSFSVEVEGTNSSGNLGVAGTINCQHFSLFHGAEILDITLRTAWERQEALVSNSTFDFNTRELGLEASISLPKFLAPLKGNRFFKYQVPQTVFTAGYNYQQRPEYTRTIANFKFGYSWKSKAYRTNYLNLLDWNMVNLSAFDQDFINSIQDLYIKSSYTDHMIMAMNYTLVDNTQHIERDNTYHYFRWGAESAGNLLAAAVKLSGRDKYQTVDPDTNEQLEYYRVLGTRFAQYLKTDLEYRYGYQLDKYNSLVSRAFLGIALPYGNFDVIPFEKKYFGGGANGIRAWQVRTLGPGTYLAPEGSYPNQNADIKLEGNLEYRYRLLGIVEGAFFLDAGNIWAINSKDNREGAVFQFNQFFKEIAIGTGAGLRFDFNYFVFRLDMGIKMRDPSLPAGRRFIWGNYPITGDHFNFNFAIGYPF